MVTQWSQTFNTLSFTNRNVLVNNNSAYTQQWYEWRHNTHRNLEDSASAYHTPTWNKHRKWRLPSWLHVTIDHAQSLLLIIAVIDEHWHTKTQLGHPINAFFSHILGFSARSHVLGVYLFSSVASYISPTAFLLSPHLALGSRPSCSALSAPIIISAFFSFVCLPDFNSSGCSYRYWGNPQLFTIKAWKLYAVVPFPHSDCASLWNLTETVWYLRAEVVH